MQACYTDNATFSDAVFSNLNAIQVRAMWKMFCLKSESLKIDFCNIMANEKSGSAQWTATYIFSTTGNNVVNNITANFEFENGKIIKHIDTFSFYKWSKQALGLTGFLLGWPSFVKNKVKKEGMKALQDFMRGE